MRDSPGLADPNIKLSTVVHIAIRIARLRGDLDNLWWLEMEMRPVGTGAKERIAMEFAGHYSPAEFEARHREIGNAYIVERTAEYPVDADSTRLEERVYGGSLPELEEKVDSLRRMPDKLEPLPGMPARDFSEAFDQQQRILTHAETMLAPCTSVLARIEHRVHTYLSDAEKELLLYGQVNADIFERNREYVDGRLGHVSADALEQITAAYGRAQESDGESRSHALTSCRRAMKSLADAIYPPTDEPAVDDDGTEHALTDDKGAIA